MWISCHVGLLVKGRENCDVMQGMQIAYLASRGPSLLQVLRSWINLTHRSTQPQAVGFASLYKFENLGEANSNRCLFGSFCISGPFFRTLSTAGRGAEAGLHYFSGPYFPIGQSLCRYSGATPSSTFLHRALQRDSTLQRVIFTRMEQPLTLVLSSPSPMNGGFRDMGFPAGNPARPLLRCRVG